MRAGQRPWPEPRPARIVPGPVLILLAEILLLFCEAEGPWQELLATVAAGQILGGPAYDALIAFTAAEHQATLLSVDQRAPQHTKPLALSS